MHRVFITESHRLIEEYGNTGQGTRRRKGMRSLNYLTGVKLNCSHDLGLVRS